MGDGWWTTPLIRGTGPYDELVRGGVAVVLLARERGLAGRGAVVLYRRLQEPRDGAKEARGE